ncbi:407_t:CDS:2 [Paraglomus brasilianum]|uniref:407_t:CDS:1 n=1 Tax=Paraglomus brasilianum TaxID=144538 RepID=A0A9N8VJ09_9GLOM|nr:407_t:CDS:2 [Paraglomus brasilianum]
MSSFPPLYVVWSYIVTVGLPLYLARRGYKKKSLSFSGALAAFFVGMGTLANEWRLFAVILLTFYYTGSFFTKFKAAKKKELDEEYTEGGQRTAIQVFCNGFWGMVLAIAHRSYFGDIDCLWEEPKSRLIVVAYVGGQVNSAYSVPPGTNGGVSPLGLLASIAGGTLIGICSVLCLYPSCDRVIFELVPLGAFAGLFGSLVDSFLGATVQQTLYSKDKKMIASHDREGVVVVSGINLLDNNQVTVNISLLKKRPTQLIAVR